MNMKTQEITTNNALEQEIDNQVKIITKGLESVVSEEELRAKIRHYLETKRPLNIKLGLDPSAPDIHLGHTVVLRKIRQMQELGHHGIIIIGDFTGKIGDPTGRSRVRNALTEEQVRINAQTYQEQVFKILDKSKTTVVYNSEWLSKLTFEDVIQLGMTTTVARMLERDDFQKRYRNNIPIGIHEFFYPLMQAYDSVEVNADIELGGTDQTFNILMGRNLQKSLGREPQIALFVPLLSGLDGVEKMSKSLGNYIGVDEPANVMFKKCMEIPDALILTYYNLVTDEHPDRIAEIKLELEAGKNPRDVKLVLAKIITSLYHTPEETAAALTFYEEAFSKKACPEDVPELQLPADITTVDALVPVLVSEHFAASNTELRRLIAQGGFSINGERCTEREQVLKSGDVLKIGKKKFVRVRF